MLEHASLTVLFICYRGVSHELVRHRVASFAQESTRYCNYGKRGLTFIIPPWLDVVPGEYSTTLPLYKQFQGELKAGSMQWYETMAAAEASYNTLLAQGWKPEQARAVLPNSLKTEVVVTANIREWRHILSLRAVGSTGKPHPQMRELMIPLLTELSHMSPVLFEDLFDSMTDDAHFFAPFTTP